MRWGVVTFPGSLDDSDALHALEQVLGEPRGRVLAQGPLPARRRLRRPAGRLLLRRLSARRARWRAFSPVMESIVALRRARAGW